jgi:hypothetical protein
MNPNPRSSFHSVIVPLKRMPTAHSTIGQQAWSQRVFGWSSMISIIIRGEATADLAKAAHKASVRRFAG